MSAAPATIGRLLASGLPSKISDADLVARFALARDGDAFAELTRRHGRMVLAVARRAVRDQHLADDVAQAAFLVLARKAHALSRPDRLAGWLFGVTRRIAQRAAAHQRREAERTVPLTAGIAAPERPPVGGDLPRTLDEELARLPESERAPLVLCYLEGLTQDEAARACGWSLRTVRRRLAAGRERLRARLDRRGVELGSALTALALAGDAGAVHLSPEAVSGSRATALARSEFRWVGRGAAGWCGGLVAVALAVAVAAGSWSGPPAHSPIASAPAAPADLPEGATVRLGSSALSHPDTLIQLRFSEDGTRLFSYGGGKVRQWDAKSGAAVPHQARDIKTRFGTTFLSPDRTKVVAPHVDRNPLRFSVREYDLATGKHTERFVVPSRTDPRGQNVPIGVQQFALSPNGNTLTEGYPHEAYLWDLKTGRVQHQLKFDGATTGSFLFSPDGKHLITAGSDGPSVRFWDTGTGKPSQVLTWNARSGVGRLAVSADGRWVAAVSNSHLSGTGTEVAVWDQTVPGPARVMMLADGFGLFGAMAFGPGGVLYLASPERTGGGATVVTKWDVATGKQLARWAGPDAGAYGPTVVEVSPGGFTLAVGTYWGVIRLYDTRTGAEIGRPSSLPATVIGVAFDQTGRNVRVSGADGSNATWDAGTGAPVSRRASPISLSLAGESAPVVPSLDGRWVLTYMLSERGALLPWQTELWDTATGERKYSGGIIGRVKDLISVPGGKHVVVLVESRVGRSVEVWDLAAGEILPHDQPTIDMAKFQWAAFPDGKTLFLMNEERAVGYDVTTGKERFSWAVADHDVLGRPRPEKVLV